jgi:hypothetical protein
MSSPSIPPWIANRLVNLGLNSIDLNHGPRAACFEHLAHESTAKAKRILTEADQLVETLGLDDELLDELLAGLTS